MSNTWRSRKTNVPMFYTPQAQQPSYHTMAVVVRGVTDPAGLTSTIRGELARLDRGVPLYRARTLESMVRFTVAAPEMRAWLFGLLAALALTLAVVGVYGVVGYLVGQRTHEIGVRLALGADRGRVLRGVLFEGLRPVTLGIAAGLVASLAASRWLSQMLFSVAPTDTVTYAVVIALLFAAAAVAILIPAGRATRVDPMIALRAE